MKKNSGHNLEYSEDGGIRIIGQGIDSEILQEFHSLMDDITEVIDPETILDLRKKLVLLAGSGSIESYRKIEKIIDYTVLSDKDRAFAMVALNFCRFRIENDLLDIETDIISGGLGGKGRMLRYYVALTGKEGLTEDHCRHIGKVFEEILEKYDSVLEGVMHHAFYVSLLILGSIDYAYGPILDEAISLCGILESDYYLTNVEIPSDERIRDWLDGKLDESP